MKNNKHWHDDHPVSYDEQDPDFYLEAGGWAIVATVTILSIVGTITIAKGVASWIWGLF